MHRTSKEKPVTAQAPSATSPRLTTSSINADPILGYKIRVLIHGFIREAKDPEAQRRIDSTTEVNYISGPYFDQEQAKRVREATVDVELQISTSAATQDNDEGDENEDRNPRVRISGLTVEEAIETVMNGFLDERRASGDTRPCGPHDLAPMYAALFGIHLLELQSHQFLSRSLGTAAKHIGAAVQMSAPGGGSSDRSDVASPMSIASDTSDEGVELEIGDSITLQNMGGDTTRLEREVSVSSLLPRNHADLDMAYFAPNDEATVCCKDEPGRLDYNHELVLKFLKYNLFLFPIDVRKMQRVLDIGTGTGIWAIEMGNAFPNALLIINRVTSNVRFEIDDVEKDWLYEEQFDFIFSRYMAGSLSDWPTLVRRVYENLRPGGWVEFQDYDFEFSSLNRSLRPDHKTHQWE
ncbi:methyltransferase domain-containing protein [Colletotrichum cuscutae]|uniref:Methyltransferase domain-containing protein n=1 Tax=Colletotrichum cuscutae TaxID=1209917 RepID=A0AAI9UWU1_9PEZI|nr:methyltransferase domain-containing protein [Colletotrichum cuscutae]